MKMLTACVTSDLFCQFVSRKSKSVKDHCMRFAAVIDVDDDVVDDNDNDVDDVDDDYEN